MTRSSQAARNQILEWAEQGALPQENVGQALAVTGATPSETDWLRFLSALLLWLGALLFAAGVIFFFAYNWDALGRFAKFGIVELLLAAAVIGAWIYGPDTTTGKASLMLASLLTGALLALIGQTYQTGADTYELFAWWAALILPWTILSRTPALWLLLVALINLSVAFYFTAFNRLFGLLTNDASIVWILTGMNAAILVGWEAAAARGFDWMQERWPARLIAMASGTAVSILGVWGIFDSRDVGGLAIPVYLAWLGLAYFYYRRQIRDLFVLAAGILSLIVFVACFLGNAMLRNSDTGLDFLLIGVIVIGMSAAGAWWLKTIASEDEV